MDSIDRQEKEVLENSDEAKNWLLLQEKERLLFKNGKGKSSTPLSTPKSQETSAMDSLFGGEEESTANSTSPVVTVPLVVEPVTKPKLGPPKRAKGGLAAMVANSKQPKLNTLEKSKLDWNKLVVLLLHSTSVLDFTIFPRACQCMMLTRLRTQIRGEGGFVGRFDQGEEGWISGQAGFPSADGGSEGG